MDFAAGMGGGGDGRVSFPLFGSAFADFGADFFAGSPFFAGFFAGAALFVFGLAFFGVAIIKDFGYSGTRDVPALVAH